METMQLIHTARAVDLTTVSDTDIEAWFAEAGLGVEVVAHCDSAACTTCFESVPARAA